MSCPARTPSSARTRGIPGSSSKRPRDRGAAPLVPPAQREQRGSRSSCHACRRASAWRSSPTQAFPGSTTPGPRLVAAALGGRDSRHGAARPVRRRDRPRRERACGRAVPVRRLLPALRSGIAPRCGRSWPMAASDGRVRVAEAARRHAPASPAPSRERRAAVCRELTKRSTRRSSPTRAVALRRALPGSPERRGDARDRANDAGGGIRMPPSRPSSSSWQQGRSERSPPASSRRLTGLSPQRALQALLVTASL